MGFFSCLARFQTVGFLMSMARSCFLDFFGKMARLLILVFLTRVALTVREQPAPLSGVYLVVVPQHILGIGAVR